MAYSNGALNERARRARATEAKVKCTVTVTHSYRVLDVRDLSVQLSGTVKTAHGDAIPRSACVPSGISDTPVSAASVPETRTVLPSGRHSPSSRLTRLTAAPDAVRAHQLATATVAPDRRPGGGGARSVS